MKKILPIFLSLPLLFGSLVFPVFTPVHAEVLRAPAEGVNSFGRSLAMDGTKLLVGAAEVVFWYDDWTDPSREPRRFSSPATSNDIAKYGAAVAFSGRNDGGGNTVYNAVVGAPGTGGIDDTGGAAFLVTDITEVNGPSEQTLVTVPHESMSGDYFGNTVAISPAGRFIVGGYYVEYNGQAYAYDLSDPATPQSLYPADAVSPPPLFFSHGVAITDTHLLVGSPRRVGITGGLEGRAFLYEYNAGDSEWQVSHTFHPDPEGTTATYFGTAVALSPDGTIAAVSAMGSPSASTPVYPSLYLFDTATGDQITKIKYVGTSS